jgi:hypothetical protein
MGGFVEWCSVLHAFMLALYITWITLLHGTPALRTNSMFLKRRVQILFNDTQSMWYKSSRPQTLGTITRLSYYGSYRIDTTCSTTVAKRKYIPLSTAMFFKTQQRARQVSRHRRVQELRSSASNPSNIRSNNLLADVQLVSRVRILSTNPLKNNLLVVSSSSSHINARPSIP